MTRLGIEPQSPRPLSNTLLISPKAQYNNRIKNKLCSGFKKLHDRVRLGKPKTEDSEAVLHTIEKIQGVELEEYQASLASYKPVWLVTFTTLNAAELCLTIQNLTKPWTHTSIFKHVSVIYCKENVVFETISWILYNWKKI